MSSSNENYNEANNYNYGTMSSNVIANLVTPSTMTINIDFTIRSESDLTLFTKSSTYRVQKYYFYYDLVISNQKKEYTKRLFRRYYREYGTSWLFRNDKKGLEELDEQKVFQGLKFFFSPLFEYLHSNNGLKNEDAVLNDLFKTVGSVKVHLDKEEPNRVCYERRDILNFLDKETFKAQENASRMKEKESALFSGSLKWISFRFHFAYGGGHELSNRTKLVLTIINSLGDSLEYDIFDFCCGIRNHKEWYESWVSFVNTEGKIKITQLMNRLSMYHECVSSLVELESIKNITNKVAGRSDFEFSFNFSEGTQQEYKDKGNRQKTKKKQDDKSSIWLGLLGLEFMPDSMDDLKKAYRNACFAFHPDRFADTGKKKWAEEQLKKISNAFNELSKLYS